MCGIAPALWRARVVVGGVVQVVPADIVENLRIRCGCCEVSESAKGCWRGTSSHNVVN